MIRRRLLLALPPALLTAAAPSHATTPPAKPRAVLAATPIGRTDLPAWKARHEAKMRELREKNPALVFYGDSITQQWEYSGPPDWKDYVPVWQRFYGHRNAVNLGYSGDTTASLLWRIQNGEASGIAPKVAVILIGANNLGRLHWSAEDTLAGIDRIVAELKSRLPTTKLLLLGVLPSDRTPWATETTVTINKALATKFPKGGAVTFLDLTHVFMRNGRLDRDLFYDPKLTPPAAPLHPTAQAQAMMAEAMEPTLAALLK